MPPFISVNHSVCTGCRTCEVACSLFHFGECNPSRSAIRVVRRERKGLVTSLPLVCQQCREAPCIAACASGALSRKGENALLAVDVEKCSACGMCTEACPAGCIFVENHKGVAVACDLCGGRPQCVALCHSHCLTLASGAEDEGIAIQKLAAIRKEEGFADT